MHTTPNRRKGAGGGFDWRFILWGVFIWLLFSSLFRGFVPLQDSQRLSYTEFKEKVRQNRVVEVTMKGHEVTGRLNPEPQSGTGGGPSPGDGAIDRKDSGPTPFETTMPAIHDPELLPLLEKHQVTVRAVSQESPWFMTLLVTLLPWVLIIGLIAYSSRKMRERMGGMGMGSVFGFAKSRAKRYKPAAAGKTFDDVAGLDNAKRELREIVAYLKDPAKFQALGGRLPKGVLLVGPPGVGKTLLAQAAAGEAGVPFFSISGSEFIEMFVGVGASRVRDMFAEAKKSAPSIIFIDELDSIGRVRGTGVGGGHDEREQTLNQILSEMDGFSPRESLVMLAATNRPDVLDPALVRPGRFDRRIVLELPQREARRMILEIHTREIPLAEDADLESLAERTVGLSGAELKNLVNEAALLAAREDEHAVGMQHLERAREKILIGLEREDVITEKEKKIIAYHEAGHALMAELLPEADPLEKVSIIPRGHSLGATEQLPLEDRHNLGRSYLLTRIAIMLGGRAAERIVFEEISTGAGDDLKKATELARRMVSHWGMSEALGPVAYRDGEPHPFLGRELSQRRDYSEHTARLIDEEVQRIVRGMEDLARQTLERNRKSLDALAKGLLERESLGKEGVDRILRETGPAQDSEARSAPQDAAR